MSDAGPDQFEDVAVALAEEVSRAVERLTQIDVEELARTASVKVEPARMDRRAGPLGTCAERRGCAVWGCRALGHRCRIARSRGAQQRGWGRSVAERRPASAGPAHRRPAPDAGGTRPRALEARAGNERACRSRRRPRAERRARARARVARSRLATCRRRAHTGGPPHLETLARRCRSILNAASPPTRRSLPLRRSRMLGCLEATRRAA
jgi:hypothetical protein